MDDDALVRARRAAAEVDGRWFADAEEVCSFGEVLVGLGFLASRRDVVDFFRRPWRFAPEHEVWLRCGQPLEVAGPTGEVLAALFEAAGRGDPPLAIAP